MQGHLYHISAIAQDPGNGAVYSDTFQTRGEQISRNPGEQAALRDAYSKAHMKGLSTVFLSINYLGPVEIPDDYFADKEA